MDFTVKDISPVKKTVSVTVSPEEINAAIGAAVNIYKESVRMDGFRKGKVPAAVIEKRFHDKIYSEARQDLVNAHINEISQTGIKPVGGINMSGLDKELERDTPYEYSMEFEVMPTFQIPPYEGLEVEEEDSTVTPEDVDRVIERMRLEHARLTPVDGNAPARDGQVANIDFEASLDGKALPNVKHDNYNLPIGANEALPEFENLVKGIPVGHTGEGPITFPADFIDPELAGKTVSMKVTVHAVKERDIPALDDEFAKKLGYEDLAVFREDMEEKTRKKVKDLNKSVAEKKLLDGLLKLTDFELPESLVNAQTRLLLTDLSARLEHQGKSFGSLGKSIEEVIREMRPEAEEMARSQVLLLAIAEKEGLEVPENEITAHVLLTALRNHKNPQTVFREMEENGMLFQLRDKLLMDKAMDLVYAKADVKVAAPGKPDASDSGASRKAEESDAADNATKDAESVNRQETVAANSATPENGQKTSGTKED